MKTLNLIEKAFLLKKTFVFAEINLDNLVAIAENLDSVTLEANQLLFKEHQTPLFMYIVAHGKIELSGPHLDEIQVIKPGEVLAEVDLYRNQKFNYQAQATTSCQLIAITKKHLSAIIAECPSVATKLLEAFAHRIP